MEHAGGAGRDPQEGGGAGTSHRTASAVVRRRYGAGFGTADGRARRRVWRGRPNPQIRAGAPRRTNRRGTGGRLSGDVPGAATAGRERTAFRPLAAMGSVPLRAP